MIGLLCWHKLKHYLEGLKKPWRTLLCLLLCAMTVMYAFFSAELIDSAAKGEIDLPEPGLLQNTILLIIAVLTLLRVVFPSYQPLKTFFPRHYPLSNWQNHTISLINDFVKPYFFYLVLFLLCLTRFARFESSSFLYSGLLILFAAHLVRRSIQYLVDFRLKIKGLITMAVFTGGAFVTARLVPLPELLKTLPLAIILALLLITGFMLENALIEPRNSRIRIYTINSGIYTKLLLGSKKSRWPLLVGFVFKILILFGDLMSFRDNGEHLFDNSSILLLLFISPLLYFNYVFNNSWGFWKNLWLNVEIRSGDGRLMSHHNLQLMLRVLLIDFAVTFALTYFTWQNIELILLFYCSSAFYLVMLSFVWSLLTPRKIETTFQFKGSVSPWSIIASMGGVLLLSLININRYFYVIIPLFIAIGVAAYRMSLVEYRSRKYHLAQKLLR